MLPYAGQGVSLRHDAAYRLESTPAASDVGTGKASAASVASKSVADEELGRDDDDDDDDDFDDDVEDDFVA